ncbi:hypothetical protein D3C84_301570 [compost metagenome]
MGSLISGFLGNSMRNPFFGIILLPEEKYLTNQIGIIIKRKDHLILEKLHRFR